ncbi:hypothetical protein [Engelhardtia mirabilis]|uniref:Uncharacterized protein n=1 Tax=Engelhardtia mirabilis TaxID=2528011 RepID=A0A518BG44_9BACT|nr:hypothetical protein Pla133_09490 [Planctomycetes bacterium Pla133]QDV00209.1 hypothetical protein Pla86_09480 [Planctomycetes bacterium Pla86]
MFRFQALFVRCAVLGFVVVSGGDDQMPAARPPEAVDTTFEVALIAPLAELTKVEVSSEPLGSELQLVLCGQPAPVGSYALGFRDEHFAGLRREVTVEAASPRWSLREHGPEIGAIESGAERRTRAAGC